MQPAAEVIEVTARALVVSGRRLLLVSHDGEYWYTPGGRMEPGEGLRECVEREVAEETGLVVQATDLLHVAEFVEVSHRRHKVECYFRAVLRHGELRDDWKDLHGPVALRDFMTRSDIQHRENVYPRFLADGTWLDGGDERIYMGFERR